MQERDNYAQSGEDAPFSTIISKSTPDISNKESNIFVTTMGKFRNFSVGLN